MCCPIIFIAKQPPPQKIIDKLMVINIWYVWKVLLQKKPIATIFFQTKTARN
jgi:hypothetical protein